MKVVEEKPGARCVRTVFEDGTEWYVPLYEMHELAELGPDGMLERARALHCEHGQLEELARLEAEVREKGNPYLGKTIRPQTNECLYE